MKRKQFQPGVRIVFTLTLALSPAFAYIVTTNFEAALGLMFFGLGMIDLVRFVTYANTQAGFRAGILFACSAFSDSTGFFAAIVRARRFVAPTTHAAFNLALSRRGMSSRGA